MSLIKNEHYIHIEGWMINELQLKGNDLLVYAIIYGFSQDGESRYTGSLQYLADWCNSTKQGIQKNLSNLLEKGYIEKFEMVKNHIKYCEYSCIPYNSVAYPIQHSCIPIQLSCTNNIDNTIEDTKENNYILENDSPSQNLSMENDFLASKPKKKKSSLYDKCYSEILAFTNNVILQSMLEDYLKMRLQMKDKPLKYANQWKGILNKLCELASTEQDMRRVIQQSLEKGWAAFYPLKDYSNSKKDPSAEYGEVNTDKNRKEKMSGQKF